MGSTALLDRWRLTAPSRIRGAFELRSPRQPADDIGGLFRQMPRAAREFRSAQPYAMTP
jgi:hypothetical protein